jgi:hypothetical protein
VTTFTCSAPGNVTLTCLIGQIDTDCATPFSVLIMCQP